MRIRLDELLVLRSFVANIAEAQACILAGEVLVNDERKTHVGEKFPSDAAIRMKKQSKYASRGGFKLEGALQSFEFDVSGLSCADFGASTGGFTDCLLQHGAASVCAIDVGYGQLAWKLRSDERVKVVDKCNVRTATVEEIGADYDLVVADLSFIRLSAVLPTMFAALSPLGALVTLVKPQFEVQSEELDNHGVVTSAQAHIDVLKSVCKAACSCGFKVEDVCASPIKGPEGNIEFFLYATKPLQSSDASSIDDARIIHVVEHAHAK